MNNYLKIFRFLSALICTQLFLISCIQTRMMEDRNEPEVQDSLDKIEGYKEEAVSKAQAITNLNQNYETEVNKIKEIYQKIEGLDFLDPFFIMNPEYSKAYSLFKVQANGLEEKIAADDLEEKARELFEIIDASSSEQNKLNDTFKVRNIFDQIKASDYSAQEAKKDIEKIRASLDADKEYLINKIDGAARDFKTLYGEKRIEALDNLLSNLKNANSLADIEAILHDDRFFSLKREISNIPIYGPYFMELLEKKLPKELNRIVNEAQTQKTIIDNFFNSKINPDPVSQAQIDTMARNLDSIFGDDELRLYANTKGIVRVEINRQNKLRKFFEEQIIEFPTPAKTTIYKSINEVKTLFTERINKTTSSVNLISRDGPFISLNMLYGQNKVDEIKKAAKEVGDSSYHLYKMNSHNLKRVLEPYTLQGIEHSLIKGGFINRKFDEIEFGKNLIRLLARMFEEDIFKKINNNKNTLIKQRVDFLLEKLSSHPTITFIEKQLAKLEKAKTEDELYKSCPSIAEDLAPYLQKNINCPEIIKNIKKLKSKAIKKGKDTNPMWEKIILTNVISQACENFRQTLEEIKQANESVVEDLFFTDGQIIKFKGKSGLYDESPQITRGESFLKKQVSYLNENILNQEYPEHLIDINDHGKFPITYSYDQDSLIKNVLDSLKSINIGTNTKPIYYSDVILEYENLINQANTEQELKNLKAKFNTFSNDSLKNKLFSKNSSHFLSQTGFDELVSVLLGVKPAEKLKKQKEITFGHLKNNEGVAIGFADFNDAILAVHRSTSDDQSKEALLLLSEFFKEPYKSSIKEIADSPGIDYSNTFGGNGQLGVLKTLVTEKPSYKALMALAKVDNINDILFNSADGKSLEERKGLDKNAKTGPDAVPSSMSNAIFGTDLYKTLFSDLKLNLEECLKALKSSIIVVPIVKSENNLTPIINAFSFVFEHALQELNKLAFDGNDNNKVKELSDLIDKSYVEKFEGFKSAVGEKPAGAADTDPKRPLIQSLINLQIKLQSAVITESSMTLIINNLNDCIKKLLL